MDSIRTHTLKKQWTWPGRGADSAWRLSVNPLNHARTVVVVHRTCTAQQAAWWRVAGAQGIISSV